LPNQLVSGVRSKSFGRVSLRRRQKSITSVGKTPMSFGDCERAVSPGDSSMSVLTKELNSLTMLRNPDQPRNGWDQIIAAVLL
jgi:hypothetical protein